MLDSKVPPPFLKIKDRLDGFLQSSHHKIPLEKCFCGEQQFLVHIPCALEYEDFPSSDERSFLFGHES